MQASRGTAAKHILVKSGSYYESELNIVSNVVLVAEQDVYLSVSAMNVRGADLSVTVSGFNIIADAPVASDHDFLILEGSSSLVLFQKNHFLADQLSFRHLCHVKTSESDIVNHQQLTFDGNTFEGFNSQNLFSINSVAAFSLRNNQFLANTGALHIQGDEGFSGNTVEIFNNLFSYNQQFLASTSSKFKLSEVDFAEISYNSFIDGVNQSQFAVMPAFQLSSSKVWTLDFHHNDLQQSRQGLWLGLFNRLKSDSVLQNNLWPELLNNSDFAIRTNTNDDLNTPSNTQFFDSDDSFMANIVFQ
jgi:hypothetical protein